MSRSYKHLPICGIAGHSDKKDKRIANRRVRTNVRRRIRTAETLDDFDTLPRLRELSDVWGFSKDGHSWFGHLADRRPALYRELMRK